MLATQSSSTRIQKRAISGKPTAQSLGYIPKTGPKGVNGPFKLDHAMAAVTEDKPIEIQSLHRKLGHISFDAIRALFRANSIAGVRLVDHSRANPFARSTRLRLLKPLAKRFTQMYGGHRPMKASENANTM
jgi:hypothetical protein